MADYYLAPSLVSLRNEINAANPNRDKSSDGWIGDASHAARVSDHNPDWTAGGVVRALDVDVDGCDPDRLIAVAIADPRTEYVISRRRIYERNNNFRARVYTGTNPHDKHTHVSIRHTKTAEKSGKWGYTPSVSVATAASSTPWGAGQTVEAVARQVIAGQWGNGTDRENRLRTAGYDPALVQRTVNAILSGAPLPSAPAPAAPARKSVDEIATEVIAGAWGNGPERSRRLQVAGYSPTEVQAAVNARVGGNAAPTRLSINALAQQVIAQQWGNGTERRRRLIAAGYDADAVQVEVNRLLK